MIVRKCDRCGKVFDDKNRPFTFDIGKSVFRICTVNRYSKTLDAFDLCDDCMENFNEWMKGEEK